MRLGLVLPRFGEGVVGGAELHGRWLAEHLAAAGHSVEVLTTCALDHHTWRNELEPGVEQHEGYTVRRFLADRRDVSGNRRLTLQILQGDRLDHDDEVAWLRSGLSSVAMEQYLRTEGDRFDLVVAMPYLFGTTYFAYQALGGRIALIPCLHDEPYARAGFVAEMLEHSLGLMFNTEPERELAKTLAPSIADSEIVAVGFDAPMRLDAAIRQRYGLDRPYVLYIGRREPGKNSTLLLDYFERYKARRGGELSLVLVGSGDDIPKRDDIVELEIDWADRDAICAGALAFCQPSVNESLSIVLLQAWAAGAPAVVHADCAVTRHHCIRSNGGLWFSNYAEFEGVLDRLGAGDELGRALGENGRSYVEREYAWPVVLGRFEDAIQRWVR